MDLQLSSSDINQLPLCGERRKSNIPIVFPWAVQWAQLQTFRCDETGRMTSGMWGGRETGTKPVVEMDGPLYDIQVVMKTVIVETANSFARAGGRISPSRSKMSIRITVAEHAIRAAQSSEQPWQATRSRRAVSQETMLHPAESSRHVV